MSVASTTTSTPDGQLEPLSAAEAAAVPEMRASKPFASFPLLRKRTLHGGDAARGLYPIRQLTFGYAAGVALPVRATTQKIKVVHGATGKSKSYTPTSAPDRRGEFDLIVKVYPGSGNSAYLDGVALGDRVAMMGPLPPPDMPHMLPVYQPARRVVAIALGIGLTHAFTTVREELANGPPDAKITLVIALQFAEQDVALTAEIAQLERAYADRFDVVRCVTREKKQGWRHGRADSKLVKELTEGYGTDDVRVLVVGTKEMKRAVWKDMENIGLSYATHSLVRKQSGSI